MPAAVSLLCNIDIQQKCVHKSYSMKIQKELPLMRFGYLSGIAATALRKWKQKFLPDEQWKSMEAK